MRVLSIIFLCYGYIYVPFKVIKGKLEVYLLKSKIYILVLVLFSTLLGMYSQKISYFLNDVLFEISPFFYLILVICISLLLLIIATVYSYKTLERRSGEFLIHLSLISVIGILILSWSIFIVSMWLG